MAAEGEINAEQIFEECNERLDIMVNHLTTLAREQGALMLGPLDFLKMKNTLSKQVNDFMMLFLAATAVTRLVNAQLAESLNTPNT